MRSDKSERVAQAVEHVTFNHGVEGSSPSALTKDFNALGRIWELSEQLNNQQAHVQHTPLAG